jgi:hypothetical protein
MKFMVRSALPYFLTAAFILLVSGCTRTQSIEVIEEEVTEPYDSLGTLEVYSKASRFGLKQAGWGTVKAVTFTMAPTPSRADIYRNKLNEKLVERADKRFNADAVIHPEYWPDLDSKSFPDGKIYARGEMIRFKKFRA